MATTVEAIVGAVWLDSNKDLNEAEKAMIELKLNDCEGFSLRSN
jgi:dsRNA-specific ribonuclease